MSDSMKIGLVLGADLGKFPASLCSGCSLGYLGVSGVHEASQANPLRPFFERAKTRRRRGKNAPPHSGLTPDSAAYALAWARTQVAHLFSVGAVE